MARIRTVKPDFWTDEKLSECSTTARLFFIGTWNFADDRGILHRSAKKLQLQILPSDHIDCEPLIQELLTHRLLSEIDHEGKKYLKVNGFLKHQKIDKPSKEGLIKKETLPEHSPSTREHSSTEGEGKRKGNNLRDANASLVTEAVGLWNELAEKLSLAKVQSVTDERKSALKARLNECGGIEGWKAALEKIPKIPWFYDGSGKNGWRADFDFLVQKSRFTKLMEGSYDVAGTNSKPNTGKPIGGWATLAAEAAQERNQ